MPKRKKPSQAKSSAIEERFSDLDKHPETAFSGSKAKLIKKHGHEEADWLKSQPAYTLFRPAPHKKGVYERAKIVTRGIDEQWQADLASKYRFNQFHTYDRDIKAAIVERFKRTLKEMIWRYFTWTNTRKWVTNSQGEDMLAKFVNAYNHRQHTTLGMSPLQAMEHDQNELSDSTIGKHLKQKQRKRLERDYSNIKVGDFVLVNTAKKMFEKGWPQNGPVKCSRSSMWT